ncbi:MAG: aldo/keto reductase [Candidatus Nanopelagicales bacterium]|nr:aldo/keto reductase [Candidatus Nanopelagicales bacterium]
MHVTPRRIGSWGLEVGRIGLGCMSMTGVYDVDQRQDERSELTVRRAIDLGVTLIDTADSYGPFTNELLVGRALASRRGAAVLSTKVGLVGRSDGAVLRNGRPDHIVSACDASLRRLQADHIDLYSLHSIDPGVPVEDSWSAMAGLVAAGKVRALGIMTDDIAVLELVQAIFPVTAVFVEYSLWAQGNEAVVRWCGERGIGVLATSPLGRGYLTGTLDPARRFAWTDLRSKLGDFSPDGLRENRVWIDRLRRVARDKRATSAQVALAWVSQQGEHIVPLAGTKRPDHLEENARAADLKLDDLDLSMLRGENEEGDQGSDT